MKKKDKKKSLKKMLIMCAGSLCSCFVLAMLFIHRRLIIAAIKGEELPQAPEGCPAHKKCICSCKQDPRKEKPSGRTGNKPVPGL